MRFERKCGAPIRNRCFSLLLGALLGSALLSLTGCDSFFPPQTSSTTPVNAGDYLYVGNAGDAFIAGFSVSTAGALSVISGSPYNNGVAVASLAVTPNNAYLYASTTSGPLNI